MKTMGRIGIVSGLAVGLCLVAPTPAAAYVGPGAGLAVIGTAIAVIGVVLAAVGGFVWYPVKRLAKAIGRKTSEPSTDDG